MLSHHWKRILGILMLFVATAFLVPISATCTILASESPVTHDQMVRLLQACRRIEVLALMLQIAAAWLFQTKPFRLLRFVGAIVGFVAISFIGGILFPVFGHWAWRVAQAFI
jgi:hypothetical protein